MTVDLDISYRMMIIMIIIAIIMMLMMIKMMMMMIIMMMMMKITKTAITRPNFKLGPPDFA